MLTPNGDLGLIDVSELSIYWHFSRYRRLRNFARFWRSQEDAIQFGEANIDALIDGYVLSDNQTRVKLRAEAIKMKLYLIYRVFKTEISISLSKLPFGYGSFLSTPALRHFSL